MAADGDFVASLPVVDFDAIQRLATGLLGWSPSEYRGASLYDVAIAMEGYEERVEHQLRVASIEASWVLNNIRASFWAKSYRPIKATDLFDPLKPGRADADPEEARQALLDKFPRTIPRRSQP